MSIEKLKKVTSVKESKKGAIEITKDLKQFVVWTAIGAGVELTFHGFGTAADLVQCLSKQPSSIFA